MHQKHRAQQKNQVKICNLAVDSKVIQKENEIMRKVTSGLNFKRCMSAKRWANA